MSNSTDVVVDDPCASGTSEEYDMPLHVGTLFIIMGCSFLGTMLPVIAKKFPFLKIRELPFNCAKMFGSGVIMATALVHMFVPANQNLTNPCLPAIWSVDYTGFAGAFCLAGILFVHFVQMMVSKEIRKATRLKNTQQFVMTDQTDVNKQDIEKGQDNSEKMKTTQTKANAIPIMIILVTITNTDTITDTIMGTNYFSEKNDIFPLIYWSWGLPLTRSLLVWHWESPVGPNFNR